MNAAADFRRVFGIEPAVVAQAPGRVNLLGDHTDYNDGFVLPTAIPHTTCVAIAPGAGADEAYSAELDRMKRFDRTGPLIDFARYVGGCIRVLAAEAYRIPPLRIWIGSEVPIGVGLSSSAALEVAMLRALDALLGLKLDPVRIALLGQRVEREHAGVNCGIMDQMAASLGASGCMLFIDTMTLAYRRVPIPARAEILVVDSGVARALSGSAYNERRQECADAARALKVRSLREITDIAALSGLPDRLHRRARHVVSENARVRAALAADAHGFGELMKASHASLRDDYEVSVAPVDRLVEEMIATEGVFGARMTGAGFGGACVALVERGAAARIGARLCLPQLSPGVKRRVIVPADASD